MICRPTAREKGFGNLRPCQKLYQKKLTLQKDEISGIWRDVSFIFAQGGVTIGSSQELIGWVSMYMIKDSLISIAIEFGMGNDMLYDCQRGRPF